MSDSRRHPSAPSPDPLDRGTLAARLDAALRKRASLLADPALTALRLVHGSADGIAGFVLEQLADVWIAQLHAGRLAARENDLHDLLSTQARTRGITAVYAKRFPRDRSHNPADESPALRDRQPWIGSAVPEALAIIEHGLKFVVRPYDGYATGLFLEQRDNRQWIREHARSAEVLNLFCYTGGFSVAAVAGGANGTASVDVSARYLDWARENFAANDVALDGQLFFRSDALAFLERARRQQRTWDLAIVDPPTFGRDKRSGRTFSLREDLDALVVATVNRLRPRGRLLLCTNHRQTDNARLVAAIEAAARGNDRLVRNLHAHALPRDFAGDDAFAHAVSAEFA